MWRRRPRRRQVGPRRAKPGHGAMTDSSSQSSSLNQDSALILIGTVHGDPRGYARALTLLNHLRPDLVTVEISSFSLRYRLKNEAGWQRRLDRALAELPAGAARHLALQRLTAQIALPFEVRAARHYHRNGGISWRPLDLGAPARRHLPRYGPELLSPVNLQNLLSTPDGSLQEWAAAEFRRARLALARPAWRPFPGGGSETGRREHFIARRLRRLISRYGRVAHLGGWEHLVNWQDSGGLWRDLADLRPRRLLLDEADRLLET